MLSNICQVNLRYSLSWVKIPIHRQQQEQVRQHIWRSLSATSTSLGHAKLEELPVRNDDSSTTDTSYVQRIAAEWEDAKSFKEIPGPTTFQMIRGFMKGGQFDGLSFTDLLLKCRKKYGDTCLIPGAIGQKPLLSIFEPSDFEKVHRTEGPYPMRPGAEAIVHYRERRSDGFFKETMGLAGRDHDWAKFRSAVNPVLMKPQNARLYLNPLLHVNEEFIHRVREIRDPVTDEMPATFYEDINRLSFESVAVVALDKTLNLIRQNADSVESEKLFKSMQVFVKSIYDLGVKPSFYKYIKTPTYRRMETAMDHIFDVCTKYIEEAIERVEQQEVGAEGNSVLEKLLKIDRKIAVIMAFDMLQAAVEATSSAMSATLLLLATNPDKQSKLREELRVALGNDKNFNIDNMKHLPYLRACIKEALRIHPITSGNLRETGMDIVLGGYRVPQGTRVVMNSNLLLSEERYFPRATEFIPERWLRDGTASEQGLTASDLSPFVYLPFGFGPRTCVGKRIVDLELELTIASLVRNFSMEFNHSTENAFVCHFINVPAIPLKFKFSELQI